ncbi:class I SAM-dependent methyltransferase [Paenibacillus dendritiformis]|uniref:class I SAM-dependent methyltransferase n=1 Tax=Paenibacillus dendritiformis TaxID=130049 RepID=UPI00387E0639
MEYTGERFIPSYDGVEIETEHVHRYKIVAKNLENLRVLDAGCGTGYGSFILSQVAESVVGIDISDETITWCEEHYGTQKNLSFIQASLEKLPFPDSEFDCIVNLEVIEHVDEKVQNAFLKEAKRVLKPSGFLIISTPNKTVYTDKSGYHNPFHIHEFYPDEFKGFLSNEFGNVLIYNQSLFMISSIIDESKTDLNVQMFKNKDLDDMEKYMIAVCSNDKNTLSQVDLNSAYKYDNPIGTSIATLYGAEQDNIYTQLNKQNAAIKVQEDNQFTITFDISQLNNANSFRFDPIENKFCICSIEEVLTDGVVESSLPLNALEYYRTGFVFMNIDPQFEIKGEFARATFITINGYLKVLNQVELSEFINVFYHRMTEASRNNTFLVSQLSEMLEKTQKELSSQIDVLQIEGQSRGGNFDSLKKQLDGQMDRIETLHLKLNETSNYLENLTSLVLSQGELLKETKELAEERGILNFFKSLKRKFKK